MPQNVEQLIIWLIQMRFLMNKIWFQDEHEERQDSVHCGLWSGEGVHRPWHQQAHSLQVSGQKKKIKFSSTTLANCKNNATFLLRGFYCFSFLNVYRVVQTMSFLAMDSLTIFFSGSTKAWRGRPGTCQSTRTWARSSRGGMTWRLSDTCSCIFSEETFPGRGSRPTHSRYYPDLSPTLTGFT